MKTLGRILHETRVDKEWTMRELATKVGVSSVYVSDIENDKRTPTKPETLQRFATVLGLDVDALVNLAVLTRFDLDMKGPENMHQKKLKLARRIMETEDNDELKRFYDAWRSRGTGN